SLPNSSFGLPTGRRSESRSAVISSALETIALIGAIALPAKKYPPANARAKAPGNAMDNVRARFLKFWRTGRSSVATTIRNRPSAVRMLLEWIRYDSPLGDAPDHEPSCVDERSTF